ncbi:DUF4388 domain-containing protein [Pyrinomonas methylaliphatogenes]|jgi:Flp pilus assembly protein TadD|uniref:DnaJ-class molecular chaperone with C-terminal Zn finger domain n=1 Tax=Pyrinomonas methylaliphatogenes TaxID=454194 RepID=A0A0B6X085_9BACT|nr:DUF4388 domain-containing protein [Pyrinomonas methylaliphatogenes]MBX5478092.1 DnaJ domain-containing protein [Pyrinomonas methylaliphatogenes]CDM66397.1 DnaJ-class molecular chaperone with C-terminal Zn finger domain [Pyrinomonas methylaliphatogenes]
MNGQLGEYPLAELIREISDESLSGALRLRRARARAALYFDHGDLVHVATNLRPLRLIECLRRWRAISAETLARFAALPDLELGAALLSHGVIGAEELKSLRARQMLESLPPLLLWTDGEWEFDPRVRVAEELRSATDIRSLLVESARRLPAAFIASRLIDDELLAPTGSPLILDLKPTEAFILSRLDAPLKLGELLSISGLPEDEARRAVYALMLAGLIRRAADKRALAPQGPPTQRREAAPTQDQERDERAEIAELLARAEAADFYQTLGVSRQATPQQIKTAYYALAKRFHPDRFSRALDAETRSRIESAFARITQAYETLNDSAARAAYDLKLASPTSAPTGPHQPDAEEFYERGLAALRAGEIERAAAEFSEAVKLSPHEARYRAALGRALMGERSRRRQAEAELQMAIKLDGSNVDYRVWLAELYRSVGLYRRALQELEHALSFDARHAEAQRLFREISGAVKSS